MDKIASVRRGKADAARATIVAIDQMLCWLAGLGFRAKELLGGIDWWRRDGHPVAASHEPGSLLAAE
jgi:hypothetical protein